MSLLPEISQASTEINKLVVQANIHQTIAPVNPAAFTDPADTLLLASRDPVIREVSVGMTGVEAVQRTVSGTPPLSLPNSLGKPLKAWEVDVLPYQEGTGDPSPSNVRPIHGTDKLTITTAGKNLFDKTATNTANGYIANSYIAKTGNIAASTNYDSSEYISVLPSTTYTLSPTTGSNPSVVYYDEAKTYIDGTEYGSQQSVTFTTPSNAKFIRCSIPYINIDTFCLNYGSTAAPYTPYIAPSQSVLTLPQTVYTGTIGSDGGESRWGEVDLGSLTWTKGNASSGTYGDYAYFTAPPSPAKASNENFICDQYKAVNKNRNSLYDGEIGISNTNTSGYRIFAVRDDRYAEATEAEFKTAMSGVKVAYELATPTTFAVPSATIPTPTGSATTWATAEDGTVYSMEVTYYKSE